MRILKISFSIIIIALMVMITLIWFWQNDAFDLKAAKIQGNYYVSQDEIFELAAIDFSKDIFAIDTDDIEQRIAIHPMLEKVSVSRFLPSALKIKVKERELIALLSGSEVSAVDIQGKIIFQYPTTAVYDLPIITGFHFQRDSTGAKKPNQPEVVEKIIQILNEIKSSDIVLYHEISEINYNKDRGIIIYLKKSNLAIIFGNDYYQRKVVYFLTIYHYLLGRNNLDKALVIDVRFRDQVVVKSKA